MGFLKPKMPTPVQEKIVAPTSPVDEASVEIGLSEDEKKKKTRAEGKGSLKVPLAPTVGTGLKV